MCKEYFSQTFGSIIQLFKYLATGPTTNTVHDQ